MRFNHGPWFWAMGTMYRQLTVFVMLSSYLLATAGALLHQSHRCSSRQWTGCEQIAAGCEAVCGHGVASVLPIGRGVDWRRNRPGS